MDNGIEESMVKTTNLNVREQYDWEDDRRKKTGFRAELSMCVESIFSQEFIRITSYNVCYTKLLRKCIWSTKGVKSVIIY